MDIGTPGPGGGVSGRPKIWMAGWMIENLDSTISDQLDTDHDAL